MLKTLKEWSVKIKGQTAEGIQLIELIPVMMETPARLDLVISLLRPKCSFLGTERHEAAT